MVWEAERREAAEQKQTAGELWKCRGCGKPGKPKAGFPIFPRAPWKSRPEQARFPHFHSSGDDPPTYRKRETRAARAGFALPAAVGAPLPLRVKK